MVPCYDCKMRSLHFLWLFLLLRPHHGAAAATAALTDRFILTDHHHQSSSPQQYLDPAVPPLPLPSASPSCSLLLLNHSFANTYGSPPASAPYSPPPSCPSPWHLVLLDFSAASSGDQYDRIAAVWLDGAELLRTSTPEPTPSPGVSWRVTKDVTRFSALLRRPRALLSVMLENIVNDVFTGVYHVNVSLHFYTNLNPITIQSPTAFAPADLILPISSTDPTNGYWFRLNSPSAAASSSVLVPANTHRAFLEIFVSFHGDDEFWYSNPPDSYIRDNNLTTGRGNGAFREVFATVDGRLTGSVVPFPVIFTGGINPLFWAPVVAIGAFDLPSYTLDLTPFLGLVADGKPHDIGLGVTDSISFWLVDANLHLWLDPYLDSVNAELVQYNAPSASISRISRSSHLNGTFFIEAARKLSFSGWVNSSFGNITTTVDQKTRFKSKIVFLRDGNYKEVRMKAKNKLEVGIKKGSNAVFGSMVQRTKFPLVIVTSTTAGEHDTYTSRTNLSHALYAETTHALGKAVTTSLVVDRQVAVGEMLVQDHSVLAGTASTQQSYLYRHKGTCYLRELGAKDGNLLYDNSSNICALASL